MRRKGGDEEKKKGVIGNGCGVRRTRWEDEDSVVCIEEGELKGKGGNRSVGRLRSVKSEIDQD